MTTTFDWLASQQLGLREKMNRQHDSERQSKSRVVLSKLVKKAADTNTKDGRFASLTVEDEDLVELKEALDAMDMSQSDFAKLINQLRTYRSFRKRFGDDAACEVRCDQLADDARHAREAAKEAREALQKAVSQEVLAAQQLNLFSKSWHKWMAALADFPELFTGFSDESSEDR